MMISNRIQCEFLSDFSSVTPVYEILTVKSGSHVMSTGYRPPGGDGSKFISFLDSFLGFINSHNYNIILGGDLNINLLVDSTIRSELVTILNLHFWHNAMASPARITENSETFLCLFIKKFDIHSLIRGVIAYAISDHLPIFLSTRRTLDLTQNLHHSTYRKINLETYALFRQPVTDITWDDVLREENPEEVYEIFMTKFTDAYHASFPDVYAVEESTKAVGDS